MPEAAVARPAAGLLIGAGAVAALACLATTEGVVPGLTAGAAMLAVAAIALDLRRRPGRPAGALDWTCFLAALLLTALPLRPAGLGALALLALPCLRRGGPGGAGAGLLLLVLAICGILRLGQGLIAPAVLAAEAKVVAGLLGALGWHAEAAGNLIFLPEAGRSLLVLRGCSVLVLLPELAVVTLAMARLLRPAGGPAWAALAAALAAATLLNLARLTVMAVSTEAATALHAGPGLAALQVAWTLLAALAALALAPRGAPRQASPASMGLRSRGAALAMAAASACIGLGVVGRIAQEGPPAQAQDALPWFAARGFQPVRTVPLGQSGSYRMVQLAGPQGCGPTVVALDRPDEILPLLRRGLAPEAWTESRLWLGQIEPWPAQQWRLPWRRLQARLRHGVAPTPALVILPQGCAS